MTKRKVAIIRGPSLSKWEMQIYEPLRKDFDLLGIGSGEQLNDIESIKFPCIFLPLNFEFAQKLPKYTQIMNAFFGDTRWLVDFNKNIYGFDILHSVELRTGFTLQAVRAKQRGIVSNVTTMVYENIPFVGDEYPSRLRLKQEVLPYIDHFFAANNEAFDALLAEGADDKMISIIPQSVDTNNFTPGKNINSVRRHLGLKKEDFIVLSAARMVWEKGWYDIVRAAYKVQSSKLKVKSDGRIIFVCVGGGPELDDLKAMVSRLGLKDVVIFTGEIAYREMPEYFQLADIFVLASIPTRRWNEQFGGVLIEAMSSGLPIVGTTNGGIVSTVGYKGGIFVPPQDFYQLADAVLSLYQNKKLCLEMGKRNRLVAEQQYEVKVVAQKIKKIWDGLLSK